MRNTLVAVILVCVTFLEASLPPRVVARNSDAGLRQANPVDLTVFKQLDFADEANRSPGNLLRFRIYARNTNGDMPASIRITETVPAATRFDAAASNVNGIAWSCPNNSGAGTLCVANVSASAFADGPLNAPFAVRVDSPFPSNQQAITNVVSIGSAFVDAQLADNIYTTTVPIDLTKAKASKAQRLLLDQNGNGSADPGDVISYTIQVTSTGQRAGEFSIIEPSFTDYYNPTNLPPYLEILTTTVTASQGTLSFSSFIPDQHTIRANLGSMPPGSSASLNLQARVRSTLPLLGEVVVNQAGVEVRDPARSDGMQFFVATNPVSMPLGARTDLGINFDVYALDPNPVDGSSTVRLYYENKGPYTTTNTVITQTLPFGTMLDPAKSTPGWACAGVRCMFVLGALAGRLPSATFGSGGIVSFTVKPTVDLPGVTTSVILTAEIGRDFADIFEIQLLDNMSAITVPIGLRPKLVMTQESRFLVDQRGDKLWETGDTVEYTVRITNTSATRAAGGINVIVREDSTSEGSSAFSAVLPGSPVVSQGFAFGSGSGITAQFGQINPGQSAVVRYTAYLSSPPPQFLGQIRTTAYALDHFSRTGNGVTGAQAHTVPLFYIQNAAIRKQIETDLPMGVALNQVTFTVAVTNTGIQPLAGWYLMDTGEPYSDGNYGCAQVITPSLNVSGNMGPAAFVQGGQSISASLASLAPGQSATVRFKAVVTEPCFAALIKNQAQIVTHNVNGFSLDLVQYSNRVEALVFGDSTPVTSLTVASADAASDLVFGERITLTVRTQNAGRAPLSAYELSLGFYQCATIVSGALTTTAGTVTRQNYSDFDSALISFGDIAVGSIVTAVIPAIVNTNPGCSRFNTILTRNGYPIQSLLLDVGSLHKTGGVTATPSPTPTAVSTTPATMPPNTKRALYLPLTRKP
jgi:uncharacterized repeat protein (TIGR01451 family)